MNSVRGTNGRLPWKISIIREDRLPPTEWRLGCIQTVILGPNGLARLGDILTARGIIRRPIVKLVVLRIN